MLIFYFLARLLLIIAGFLFPFWASLLLLLASRLVFCLFWVLGSILLILAFGLNIVLASSVIYSNPLVFSVFRVNNLISMI